MSKGWALIINPQSKSGATKKKMATVKRLLEFNKIHFLFFETRNSGDELNIVEKAVKEGFRKIVCVGGDGTIQKNYCRYSASKDLQPERNSSWNYPFRNRK